jgi:hypothetical protein
MEEDLRFSTLSLVPMEELVINNQLMLQEPIVMPGLLEESNLQHREKSILDPCTEYVSSLPHRKMRMKENQNQRLPFGRSMEDRQRLGTEDPLLTLRMISAVEWMIP